MKFIKKFSRILVLYIVTGVFFTLVAARLIFFQVMGARDARSRVDSMLSLSVKDPAPRGDICDRNGKVLAGNRKGYFVLVKKGENAHLALTVKNLAEYSGTGYKELLLKMQNEGFSANNPFVFSEDAEAELVTKIMENPENYPCAQIITRPIRDYFYPETAVHLLGRCGVISREEYKTMEGYGANDYIGKQGTEKAFEEILKGTDGSRAAEKLTPSGMRTFTDNVAPIKGKNVILTVDIDLQTKAEEALTKVVSSSASGGAFVVTDVHSGEILALASNPTYNINDFNKNYTALSKNPAKPFFNRSISGLYAPGSTFKPVTAIAAMESGALTPQETMKTLGKYEYYNHTFRCNIYREKGKTHGVIDVSEALGVSCNYFFYELGHRTGIDKIAHTAYAFGLGASTGIELTAEEAKGRVATPESRRARGGYWYAGDTLQAAIGQSDNLFTPLALANYAAAIANGGTVYRARILKGVESQDGSVEYTKPEILNKVDISAKTLRAVHQGMVNVTTEGTAAEIFKDFPLTVAGKTGSAQVGGHTNGLFIGFAPADNPKIAFCAVVEGAPSGNTAAQAAKNVLSYYFNIQQKGTAQ